METKSFLYALGGVAMGVAMTMMCFMVMSIAEEKQQPEPQEELVMFKQPKQEVKATLFEVRQVFGDGYALATIREGDEYMEKVLLEGSEESAYYDGKKVRVGRGQRALLVGTFRYTTIGDFVKTVPVVRIVNGK